MAAGAVSALFHRLARTKPQSPGSAVRPRQKRDEVGSSCAVARFDRAVVRPIHLQRPKC